MIRSPATKKNSCGQISIQKKKNRRPARSIRIA